MQIHLQLLTFWEQSRNALLPHRNGAIKSAVNIISNKKQDSPFDGREVMPMGDEGPRPPLVTWCVDDLVVGFGVANAHPWVVAYLFAGRAAW